jgi:Tol biopolymer transport system component
MRAWLFVAASLLFLGAYPGPISAETASRQDGRIAFQFGESGMGGGARLAVMDADGANPRVLLRYVYAPSWSPDGRLVAFQSGRDIEAINVDGRPKPRLLARNGGNGAWSPSGRAIAFDRGSGGDSSDIWIANLDNHAERRLLLNANSPQWSSDGKKLAFERGKDVWVFDLARKTSRRILRHAAVPDWSPDGARIVFARRDPNPHVDDATIFVAHPDGTAQRRVADGDFPVWSPDGRELAFIGKGHGPDAVIRIRLDGSHRRILFEQRGGYCGCTTLDWARAP